MNYELFQQGPSAYIPVIIISLLITVFAYGIFPFAFAKVRKSPITEIKYSRICYGANAVICILFGLSNNKVNPVPYLLWTSIFLSWGKKLLDAKRILQDTETSQLPNSKTQDPPQTATREVSKANISATNEVSRHVSPYEVPVNSTTYPNNTEYNAQPIKIKFCRKCGNRLPDNSCFCNKCGTKIMEL